MNGKTLLPVILLASLLTAMAEEPRTDSEALVPVKASTEWKPNPALWREFLDPNKDQPTVSIGKSEFRVGGPLVETIRRPPSWSDLSLGKKILSLPVINLLIPQPMPSPPGSGGKYFAWGQSSLPWTAVVNGAAPGVGRFSSAVNHEPIGLISFGW